MNSKKPESYELEAVEVIDQEGCCQPSNSNQEVTQADMAAACQVSVTTIKGYLKQVAKIFPGRTMKAPSNRYCGWVLDEVISYQNSCGGFKVVNGQLQANSDRIDFEAYRRQRNVAPEPAVEVLPPDDEEGERAIVLPAFNRAPLAEMGQRQELATGDVAGVLSSFMNACDQIGEHIGALAADRVLMQASTQMGRRVEQGLQRLANASVQGAEGGK